MIKTIKTDLVKAMKEKDEFKKSVLRMLLAKLEQEKVKFKLSTVEDLTGEQVIEVISRNVKETEKEIQAYVAVGRSVEKQSKEITLLKTYLPKQLTDEEVLKHVVAIAESIKESGGKIGDAMKSISSQLRGKTDMKKVSELMRKQF